MPDNLWNMLGAGILGGLSSQSISFVFNYFTGKQEIKRSEIRNCIREANDILSQSCQCASEVWETQGGQSPDKIREVVCLNHELSEILSCLWLWEPRYKIALKQSLHEFHRTTTGEDFDSSTRTAKPEKILSIRNRATFLKNELRKVRFNL